MVHIKAPPWSIVNTTVVHDNVDMTREDPQMKLRLPADLKDQLAALAEANGRSLNAEVVVRLEESLGAVGGARKAIQVDEHTLDLFAEKVGQVLDEREKRRTKR
ncbi:hypothetical protein R69608_07647 [Paraburkholderia nemoris]|uniref:Arc family DNA-binding protein n=1 Tax=Paraburkholderia nemoris TaxID=2793076 RepID=UPI00191212F0|nr:Arc family DNA-binding protein [Paraburkholderia nemoris]CAE6971634.1 hypothetical protein R69608_07647 [Paraburkholderia nemoris]